MNSIKLASTLHEQVLTFVDELSKMITGDNGELISINFFYQQYPAEKLMEEMITFVLPWESQIKSRDDDFFYSNKQLFGDLPDESVDYFSNLWKSDKLDDEDKSVVWEYFDVFIECAKAYKKIK